MSTTGDKRIKAGVDKRQDERFSSHAPIIVSNFDTMLHREYASVTFNICKNGLCLEAAEAIKPGTTLLIRRGNLILDNSYDVSCKLVRTSSLAEVRWCQEQADKLGTYYLLCRCQILLSEHSELSSPKSGAYLSWHTAQLWRCRFTSSLNTLAASFSK